MLSLFKFFVGVIRFCHKMGGITMFCFYLFSQNWFAFSKLHKPLFTEHGVISFPNTNPPLDKMNNAYCQVRKEFFAKAVSTMLFTAFSLTDISLTYITVYIFKTLLVIYTLRNRQYFKTRGQKLQTDNVPLKHRQSS